MKRVTFHVEYWSELCRMWFEVNNTWTKRKAVALKRSLEKNPIWKGRKLRVQRQILSITRETVHEK